MATDFSKLSYWELVWMQFRKKKMAMSGLYIIAFLFLVAVFCPLFIGDRPYYLQIGTPLLQVQDIAKPQEWIESFREKGHPFSAYLYSLFSQKTKNLLKEYDHSSIQTLVNALVEEINSLATQQPLYNEKIAKQLSLGARVQKIWEQNPQGENLILANRKLLEQVYEGKIYPYFPLQFPWLRSLFDTNYYECSIDLIFNLFMVLSPLFIFLYWLNQRWTRYSFKYFLAICICLFSLGCMLLFSFPYSEKYRYYKQVVQDAQKAKRAPIRCLFPLVPYSYKEVSNDITQSPSSKHIFGTDVRGRDVFARMVFGLRIAFSVGVVAVSIYVTIGIVLGSLAGYFGGLVDLIISRFIEIMLCFPFLFFILTIAAMIEKRSIFHIMAIIGVVSWPSVARLTRAEFLRQREMDYVQAAISQGIPKYRIVFSHILPNSIAPVLVAATFGIAWAILYESTLSFLGVGDPNVASWGELLTMGRKPPQPWWLIMIPGFGIFLMVALFNLVGDGFRDSLDPKLRE